MAPTNRKSRLIDLPVKSNEIGTFANTTYRLMRQLFKDERDQASVIAILAATFLMNVDNDQEFHDAVTQVIIETIVSHPPYESGVTDPDDPGDKVH